MIEVWAPKARAVELEVNGRRLPLRPVAGGRHCAEIELSEGRRYAFRLDGGDPLPDPRSRWQPEGVHGPSAAVDHAGFAWTDAGWSAGELRDQVFYELHVGTFTPEGTFEAAIGRLQHLVDLGVTAVELMPVAEFIGDRGWGYDGVDLFAPHHAYGGPIGLKKLVDACHAHGLAVALDVVYNHVGTEGDYLGRFGPYFSSRHETVWGGAVNLDGPDSQEVREFVVANALAWLRDYRCDGLRLDAVHAIPDAGKERLLPELTSAVRELERSTGRRLWVVAESSPSQPRLVADVRRGGYGLDGQWYDRFHHALHALLTGETSGYYRGFGRVADLAGAFQPGEGLPPDRLVVCAQNHDQVGNRARGDRLSQLLTPGLLRCAAALVLTSPFVPLLFQGEEWGAATPFQFFSDHRDQAIATATTEGRIREFAAFGWAPDEVPDPQDPAAFERSRLDWTELDAAEHAALLRWHRDLVRLRRARPDLRGGQVDVRWSEAERWLVVDRGEVVVACNLASVPRRLPASGSLVLASEPSPSQEGIEAVLAPESVAILSKT